MVGVHFDASALTELDNSLYIFLALLIVTLFAIKIIPSFSPLYSNLRNNYATSFMNNPEQRDTEYLIKASWTKHNTGSLKPGIDTVSKVPKSVMPERIIKDLDK